jgi:two-component system cell cycle sensor histidine kinase/response regulator CckA
MNRTMATIPGIAPGPAETGTRRVLLVCIAAAASTALLLWLVRSPVFAGAFLAGVGGFGTALLLLGGRTAEPPAEPHDSPGDLRLLRAAMDTSRDAVVLVDEDGRMVCANQPFRDRFGAGASPLELPDTDREALAELASAARKNGFAARPQLRSGDETIRVEAMLAGAGDRHLLWRIAPVVVDELARDLRRLVTGEAGLRLGQAGLMAALADGEGRILAANPAFAARASGQPDESIEGAALVELLTASQEGAFQFASEGRRATPLHILQVPVAEEPRPVTLFLLLDAQPGLRGSGEANDINNLLEFLPLGLALVDMDGRFTYLNEAFRKAAGLAASARPVYPGDLVVDDDKAAVSDAVRRFARGPTTSSDMAVRLKSQPEEPVALTIAGTRGLGNAAVILSLKDNKEADRLKRQVAQATKMQAVGQLAGGVAHDFNNILTAILGYCDLMLMRHTPGDSDYDDIQQIRSNSNRAASLTRQLLAFSRQQTLRPQVLQLPDVISEVSNLLKRLLGETVKLQVKHGRNLGAVRADPGQLEQVIVNLAVNARDAMPEGGTLTIQTFAVSTDDSRRIGSDVLPIAEYTALRVADTGVGIPRHLLGKIFEPFFTTKEVGKGTGLGLSTVYGIVKQSGGFIFAESEEGAGTSFTVYLPVHRVRGGQETDKAKTKQVARELWGTGTILLVEDEAMVRAVAERALTRHGYTVLTAENGEAALEILSREPQVDLMISDVVMPTMDGPTTVREARKTHPDLPILFISGYAEEQLRKSIDLERVAFLAKPFSVQSLAEAARQALASKDT